MRGFRLALNIVTMGALAMMAGCEGISWQDQFPADFRNFVEADPGLTALAQAVERQYTDSLATLTGMDVDRLRHAQESWEIYLPMFCPVGKFGASEEKQCLDVEYRRWAESLRNPKSWAITWLDHSEECTLKPGEILPRKGKEWATPTTRLDIGHATTPMWGGTRYEALIRVYHNPIINDHLIIGQIGEIHPEEADDWIGGQEEVRRFAWADAFTLQLGRNGLAYMALYFVRPREQVAMPASEVMLKVTNGRLAAVCSMAEPIIP